MTVLREVDAAVRDLAARLMREYRELPSGRVLSVVTRCNHELRRLSASAVPAELADYLRVVEDTARRQLERARRLTS